MSVFAGFTCNAEEHLAELRSVLGDPTLGRFWARYATKELFAIRDEVEVAMFADGSGILSLGVADAAWSNAVLAGARDIDSPEVAALKTRFGDALDVYQDEPVELM